MGYSCVCCSTHRRNIRSYPKSFIVYSHQDTKSRNLYLWMYRIPYPNLQIRMLVVMLTVICLIVGVKGPSPYIKGSINPEVVAYRDTRETGEELVMVERKSVPHHENRTLPSCPTISVIRGPSGIPGIPGSHGRPGVPGSKGDPGFCECPGQKQLTTKQCSWDDYNFAMNLGPIQSCSFNKRMYSTALRVEWHGSTRVKCLDGNPCCNRWYFTFDGSECRNPQTIEGLVYMDDGNATINMHRQMSVVGLCMGLSSGLHDIGFAIGDCGGEYVRGVTRTGWNSASRIIIQEILIN